MKKSWLSLSEPKLEEPFLRRAIVAAFEGTTGEIIIIDVLTSLRRHEKVDRLANPGPCYPLYVRKVLSHLLLNIVYFVTLFPSDDYFWSSY
jgi:hypothetical protein